MARYLRIKNRGTCPRWRLFVIGASTKRALAGSSAVRGLFGSGTKFAPPAALRLGLEIHVASADKEGPYFLTYDAEPYELEGEPDQLVIARHRGSDEFVRTHVSIDAFPNWSKPVGADRVREFPILREYLNNAFDADAEADHLDFVTELTEPPEGWTYVYLSLRIGIIRMMRKPDRYFKHLAGPPPFFGIDGLGAIYPKSETGRTRLFSLGTLAFCSASTSERTVFDYSFDQKSLLTEERTFSTTSSVIFRLGSLLARMDQPQLAGAIIAEATHQRAEFEMRAISLLPKNGEIPGAAAWVEGWNLCFPDGVVLSHSPSADETAVHVCKKTVVTSLSASFQDFLRHCGVPDALSVLPGNKPEQGWIETGLTPEQSATAARVIAFLGTIWTDLPTVPWFAFRPLTEEADRYAGFVPRGPDGKLQRKIAIKQSVFSNEDELIKTFLHEYRHVRTGAADATRDFENAADSEVLLLIKPYYESWKRKQTKTPSK